jgi:hypothetical protein
VKQPSTTRSGALFFLNLNPFSKRLGYAKKIKYIVLDLQYGSSARTSRGQGGLFDEK